MVFADEVEREGCAGVEPIGDIPRAIDRDRDHRRLEAGLHDPAREHAGFLAVVADGEDENAAGDAAEDSWSREVGFS